MCSDIVSPTYVVSESINSKTIPDRFKWKFTMSSLGCPIIQNKANGYYLYLFISPSGSTGYIRLTPTLNNNYNTRVWRILNVNSYTNLSSFSISSITMDIGESSTIAISKSPSNATWCNFNDFSFPDSDLYFIDKDTGVIVGYSNGSETITVTNKITGKTSNVNITINNTLATIKCVEGSTCNVYSIIGHNNTLLSRAYWESSDSSVATVNTNGIVTALSSGYALISALYNGNYIIMCELEVVNIHNQMISCFTYNEIQYLYCPSSYLNTWTIDLSNSFDYKVEILYALRPYYMLPMSQQPDGDEIATILLNKVNLNCSSYFALYLFNECYLGYLGRYNQDYLTNLRIQYFGYLKEITIFCAFSMALNLDPVNTGSNCQGYDDFVYDLSKEWGHNETSTNVMLGSNGYQGKFYFKEAEKVGYRYFYSTNYEYFYSEYGPDFVKSVNIRYLQRCISSNCTFYFCNNPITAPLTSSLHLEYSYLLNYYTGKWGNAYLKYNSSIGYWFFDRIP